MSKTFDQGKDEVARLCQYFATNRQAFLAPGVKEAHVRQMLIDPFFEALGWDMRNTAMVAPQYREVIPEASLDVEGQQKAPDYAFRVVGSQRPAFYAEAKKCGENINADPGHAYQLRRYGWSAKVALSILTDFEELAVYDCALRPRESDKASHARIQYFRCEEYPARWRELWDVFSREAVWSGAFDQYAASKRKRGTSEVDVEILKEIEGWRDELARNIALRNANLSGEELNRAVQLTIDRIVFLRMAEDRGLESYQQLLSLTEQPEIYENFVKLCRKADDRYNSGLFHFQKEAAVAEAPDTITPRLAVDDRVLRPILQKLYFAHGSPYEFSVLPVEILGTVYERFLGKVIRLTAGHQAKVEEKPEVRKAGGVHYTPAYIVNYIVPQTVGRLIEDRSPAQLAGKGKVQPLRVLDMACGSGSFLLGAYQYLLDHCLKWYIANGPENFPKAVYVARRSVSAPAADIPDWRLTIAEKKRILTTHIFGVDIDAQAVEVSKLSLLLKVLQGESAETVGNTMRLFHERALPNLSDNIKCGNSLIGPDYFTSRLIPDAEEFARVKAFDWQREFPAAFPSPSGRGQGEGGGFDCGIGHPPYGGLLTDAEKDYLLKECVCQSYQLDTYLLFVERALRLTLKAKGDFGMIIPNPWLTNILQTKARRFILSNARVLNVVHFQFPVFPKVTVDTEIVVLEKASPQGWKPLVTVAGTMEDFAHGQEKNTNHIRHQQDKWNARDGGPINIFLTEAEDDVQSRLKVSSIPLDMFCKINVGIKPYQIGKGKPSQTAAVVQSRPFDSNKRDSRLHRPYLRGCDIGRYCIAPVEPRFLKYGLWLAEPRPAANFDAPVKLLMRQTGDSLIAAIDRQQYLCMNNMHVIVPLNSFPSPQYLLGIINSRLLNWFYQTMNPEMGEALAEVKKTNVAMLPVHPIDPKNSSDKAGHDRMVKLVDSMLAMHKQLASAKSEAQRVAIGRQIESTDAEIDRLVYDLYGLTKAEIAIVEGEDKRERA
jgi:hypothetical protein